MALNAYLKLKGQKQGDIQGSVTQKGREGKIEIFQVNHEVLSPRDSASGLPTGKRQHKPMSLLCALDKATPLLYNALCNNENITDWALEFWRPSAAGTEKMSYTIKLTNANVSKVQMYMANNKDPLLTRYPELMTYEFTYQKIEWTWVEGGIMAMDDWETPV